MFIRTCVAAYRSDGIPGECVRTVVGVQLFMFFQCCILLSYTGTDSFEGSRFVGKV